MFVFCSSFQRLDFVVTSSWLCESMYALYPCNHCRPLSPIFLLLLIITWGAVLGLETLQSETFSSTKTFKSTSHHDHHDLRNRQSSLSISCSTSLLFLFPHSLFLSSFLAFLALHFLVLPLLSLFLFYIIFVFSNSFSVFFQSNQKWLKSLNLRRDYL